MIRIAPVLSLLLGLYSAAALLLFLNSGSDGSVGIGDVTLGRREFLLRVIPILTIDVAGCLALAYGFVRERGWARPLCVVYPAGLSVLGLLVTPLQGWLTSIPSAALWALLSIPLYWYFYRKPSTRAYYAGLASAQVGA